MTDKEQKHSSPTDEPIATEDLVMLSLEELETRFLQIYAALEKTFYIGSGYIQGSTHSKAPFQKGTGLDPHSKQIWEELKATVDAIITHAVFAEWNEQEWNKLAHAVREEITLRCLSSISCNIVCAKYIREDRDKLGIC